MKTFKLVTAIVIAITHSLFTYSQTPYSIKEQYDFLDVGHYIIPSGYLDPTIPYDGNLSNRLGDRVADVMTSYLKMYKTTKDKAYLVKFINLCIEVQSLKMGNNLVNNPPVNAPIWSTTMYQNGRILAPMAEFVHLVKMDDQSLQTVPFPVSLINNANFNTYLDFADWLKDKVAETLNYMIDNYWIDDSKAFKKFIGDNTANEINQQSDFGVTLFYIGHAYPNSFNTPPYNYLHKADAMALLYKSNIDIDDKCYCFTYQYPLLRTTSSNAYWWFNSGWRITYHGCIVSSCFPFLPHTDQPKYLDYTRYREDISHAISTLFFPRVVYDYNFSSSITQDDMIRWRNTFAKNIYDGSGNFHNSVEGTDNDIDPNVGSQINDLRFRALGWVPFYKFDDYDSSPISLYDIVMNYYANGIPGDATTSTLNYPIQNIPEGSDYLGLSEVTAAQWDKECVNLTLHNRDVIYDQNFIVKNKLIVAPQQSDNNYQAGVDDPFAEPKTFVDNGSKDRFVVEPGTTVNMVAGESIELLPGFEAKAGSNFSASISPSACTDGMRLTNSGNYNNSGKTFSGKNKLNEDSLASQAYIKKHQVQLNNQSENTLAIAPNPFNGTTLINFSVKEKSIVTLKIVNQYGQEIFNEINNVQTEQGNYTVPFNGINLAKGIYYCILQINGQILQTKKIIFIN